MYHSKVRRYNEYSDFLKARSVIKIDVQKIIERDLRHSICPDSKRIPRHYNMTELYRKNRKHHDRLTTELTGKSRVPGNGYLLEEHKIPVSSSSAPINKYSSQNRERLRRNLNQQPNLFSDANLKLLFPKR